MAYLSVDLSIRFTSDPSYEPFLIAIVVSITTFSTDEDARQAMTLDGRKLKEVGVRLLLSSRSEMQKVIETARQQTVSAFQLNAAPPVVQVPPPILANQQLLLAQQLIQQQQQLPYHSTVSTMPVMAPKLDIIGQQTLAAQIVDRNRNSNDKRVSTVRRRDSRSRSRDRDRRGRSRSTDRSPSRERSRRNRSRSRSRDRTRRRGRRDKRSYSRDEYDSDDSDSRGSRGSGGRKKNTPPRSNVQVWDNQGPNNFRATVYANGGINDNGNGRPTIATAAFQQLRERRNETVQEPNRPDDLNAAIDLTEDDHNCCVKVSNIEKTTGYGELRRFFQGLPVRQNGLKMINDSLGKRTGIAYVRFHRPESRKFAIMRSGQVLNGSKLEVHTLDDNEFEEAVDSFRPSISNTSGPQPTNTFKTGMAGGVNGNNNSKQPAGQPTTPQQLAFDQIVFTCLKITDVPSLTTEQDIMRVFSEYGLMHIIIAKDKHKRNCAFIKLNRAEDAKRALREKNAFTMAHKAVTVTMCSEAVFDEVMNSTSIEQSVDTDNEEKGDPSKAVDEDERGSGRKPKTDKKSGSRWGEKVVLPTVMPIIPPMLITSQENGAKKVLPTRWTCEEKPQLDPILSQLNLALPFLSTLLPQAAAAVKNVEQQRLQQPPQQPAIVSRDPRLKNMAANNMNATQNYGAAPRGVPNDPRNNNPRFSAGNRREDTDCVMVSNLEAACSDLDVASFFSKAGIVPLRVHILLSTSGAPSGDAFVEFSNPKEAHAALLQNERLLGKNPVFVETIPREQVDEVLASFDSGTGGGPNRGPAAAPQPSSIYNQFAATGINPALMQGGNPRMPMQRPPFMPGPPMNPTIRPMGGNPETNVIALNNVPYRAGVEDIIEFFASYDIRPQDVMRRFNDQGQVRIF